METNETSASDGDELRGGATTSSDAQPAAPADGAVGRGEAGEDDRLEPEGLTQAEKRLLGGLAAAGLVILLIIVAVNLFSGDDAADPETAGDPAAATGAGDGPADGAAVVPTVESLSPTTGAVVDAFDRDGLDGGDLGWSVLGSGEWTVSDGTLRSGSEPEGVSPMVVTEVPEDFGADWAFSITVDQAGQSTGFVWGVEDENNYWEMRVNTEYAVVVFNQVTDGTPTQVKTLGPAGFGSGERYTIQHVGDTVTLAANGQPFVTLSDPSLEEPRQVGVIASTDAEGSFKLAEVANIEAAG
ncbi:MAG: hypothetical protein KDB24_08770 [Microthrixaceae bacterium]|nr:hypothetical protein [Microthrixaceae bacterium]